MIALDCLSKRKKETLLSMATALRVGYHADKKEWKKFTRKMSPKD